MILRRGVYVFIAICEKMLFEFKNYCIIFVLIFNIFLLSWQIVL